MDLACGETEILYVLLVVGYKLWIIKRYINKAIISYNRFHLDIIIIEQ